MREDEVGAEEGEEGCGGDGVSRGLAWSMLNLVMRLRNPSFSSYRRAMTRRLFLTRSKRQERKKVQGCLPWHKQVSRTQEQNRALHGKLPQADDASRDGGTRYPAMPTAGPPRERLHRRRRIPSSPDKAHYTQGDRNTHTRRVTKRWTHPHWS